jgi:hypothetical protein
MVTWSMTLTNAALSETLVGVASLRRPGAPQ